MNKYFLMGLVLLASLMTLGVQGGANAQTLLQIGSTPSIPPAPTDTFAPAPTDTFAPAPTDTFAPPPTDTFAPAPTDTFPPPPTNTFPPPPTDTFAPPPTNTFPPAPTNTFPPAPTNTFAPPPTRVPPTATPAPLPSPTPTFFFFPTWTPQPTPTFVFNTPTPFFTPTPFIQPTPFISPTPFVFITPTPSFVTPTPFFVTPTPFISPTPFVFITPTPFFFSTPTPFFTQTPFLTQTPLPSLTPSLTFTPTMPVVGSSGFPPTPAQPALDPSILRRIKAGTIITLAPPQDTGPGGFTLTGSLRDWSGANVPDASIIFTLNGSYLGQTRTDSNGSFSQAFKKPLDAGVYTITASFNGTRTLAYSSAATTLTITASTVEVQTVPPVAGVTFQLNGQSFVTGDDGSASIKVDKPGTYRLEALISLFNDPTQKIEFGRWLEDDFQPFINIQVPTSKVIPVGLNIFNQVGMSFVDLDGLPVDEQRISQFTIRSEQGDTFVLNTGASRWLPASRITRRAGGLVVTKLLYSVINVKLDGSNVVNESQQQFYAEPNDIWKISLLLYSLRIRVNDGLFGSSIGKSINLLFPDGQINDYPLDRTGQVEIHGLARGNYSIQVTGAKGMGNKMPVALSRNQDANIKVLTYTDLGIVGIFGFFVALALLLYGRRSILISSLQRRQRTVKRAGNALLLSDDIQPAESQGSKSKDELIKWS